MRLVMDDGVTLEIDDLDAASAGERREPPLLILHGFGGFKDDFADQLENLSAKRRVVIWDQRGHGFSDGPDDPSMYSLDRLGADAVSIADQLGIERFVLLGHSMGGMVARRLMLGAPATAGRIEKLILMGTSARCPDSLDPAAVKLGAQVALDRRMDVLRKLMDESSPMRSDAHAQVLAARPDLVDRDERRWNSLSPVMWATLAMEVATQPDQTSALGALRTPTLVIVGEHDAMFFDACHVLAVTIPRARLAVIPGAGHSAQVDEPEIWIKTVEEFLDEGEQ